MTTMDATGPVAVAIMAVPTTATVAVAITAVKAADHVAASAAFARGFVVIIVVVALVHIRLIEAEAQWRTSFWIDDDALGRRQRAKHPHAFFFGDDGAIEWPRLDPCGSASKCGRR